MSRIRIKSQADIEKLAEGGKILGDVLDKISAMVAPGVVPSDLDQAARALLADADCEPSFLNYAPRGHEPYPAALCVSVNEAVVHGLPSRVPFTKGDLVGIDLGLIYEGVYYLDSARTIGAGELTDEAKRLNNVTAQALLVGIEQARAGNRTGDIGAAIQAYVEREGMYVVTQLVGHGVGFAVHEPPQVPNYGEAGVGEKLVPGLVIAIEPMVTISDPTVDTADDGWTIVAPQGKLASHFEHTVAITEKGPRILTR